MQACKGLRLDLQPASPWTQEPLVYFTKRHGLSHVHAVPRQPRRSQQINPLAPFGSHPVRLPSRIQPRSAACLLDCFPTAWDASSAYTYAINATNVSLNAASIAFTCYMLSWLVHSERPLSKHPVVLQLNSSRKATCTAFQAFHAACVVAAMCTAALQPQAVDALLPQLSGPLVVAASISTLVLGSVELTRKQISKAQALQLDQQGPGAAHPIMVQGAQSAAKVYVWAFLTGLHGVLSFTQGGVCVSSLMFVLLLGAGGFCFWAGERDY